jgi:hypothetical protein
MTSEIRTLLLELDWNNKEKQNRAIKALSNRKDYDLKVLISPLQVELYDTNEIWWKDVAEGCAIVISIKSDGEIISLLPDLLVWLQDLNWPGATIILDRLKKILYSKIEAYVNQAITKAKIDNDDQWVEWLNLLRK